MSACPNHKETLMLDIYGELTQNRMAAWEQHLSSCPDCKAEKEAIANMHKITKRAFEAPSLGEDEAAAMRKRVIRDLTFVPKNLQQRKPSFFFSRGFIPVLASACVLIIVLGFMASKFLTGPGINMGTRLVVSQEPLPADEVDIINNMDLLMDLDALDRLAKVIDPPQASSPHNNVQGKNSYGKKPFFS